MKITLLLVVLALSGCKSYFRVETNYASPLKNDENITINAKVEAYGTNREAVGLHEKVVKFLHETLIKKK